ncbi:MAG: YbjN domain-containing protein [Corynebacterium sp.]|nr:YbjN domain-containing protein [Corynebacterium sp.]
MTDNTANPQPSSSEENSTPSTKATIPDSPVLEVTLDRLGDILSAENLAYRIDSMDDSIADDGRVLRTGFSNAMITFHIHNNNLFVDAMWRGQFSPEQGTDVLFLTNQWNAENFNPTLRFFETQNQQLAIAASRLMDISCGASRNQLGSFATTTFDAILTAFNFVETKHPETVTWETPNHD